jgi:hypothetical protein
MMGNGRMIRGMGWVLKSLRKKEGYTMATLLMINTLEMEYLLLKNIPFRGSLKMGYFMVKGRSNSTMGKILLVLFQMVKKMQVDIHILMAHSIMEHIKIIYQMEQGSFFGEMASSLLDAGKQDCRMGLEWKYIKMERNLRDFGKLGNGKNGCNDYLFFITPMLYLLLFLIQKLCNLLYILFLMYLLELK